MSASAQSLKSLHLATYKIMKHICFIIRVVIWFDSTEQLNELNIKNLNAITSIYYKQISLNDH